MKINFIGKSVFVAGFTMLAASVSLAQDHQDGAKHADMSSIMCPISGKPVSLFHRVKTDEGPAFFCCSHCVGTYVMEPGKFKKAITQQHAALAKLPKVQVTCPVTGEVTDPKVKIEHEGKTVSFCCGGCVKKFQKDPKSYAKALANSYTYQTKCPVMGGTIAPKAFTKLPTGETIYYCCNGCCKKLMADPAKYSKSLVSQCVNVDWDAVKKMNKGK